MSYYFPWLAEAITQNARQMLYQSALFLKSKGCEVIQGDTDSLFVKGVKPEMMPELHQFLADKFEGILLLKFIIFFIFFSFF